MASWPHLSYKNVINENTYSHNVANQYCIRNYVPYLTTNTSIATAELYIYDHAVYGCSFLKPPLTKLQPCHRRSSNFQLASISSWQLCGKVVTRLLVLIPRLSQCGHKVVIYLFPLPCNFKMKAIQMLSVTCLPQGCN